MTHRSTRISAQVLAALLAATAFTFTSCGPDPQPAPAKTPALGAAATSEPDEAAIELWLTKLDGWLGAKVPFPAGDEFPVGFSNTATGNQTLNASFHLWSYQMFLWLMEGSGQGAPPNFATLPTPERLFTGGKDPGAYPSGENGLQLSMLDKSKADTLDADEVFQAGPGNTVLVDQKGQIVFYSVHVNQSFWDFVRENDLYTLAGLQAVEANNPNLTFPIDALELKVSWRIAKWLDTGEELIPSAADRFYTTNATVPKTEIDGSSVKVLAGQTRQALVAMVGMHVTGVVKDHFEFIWATFEHHDNAPDSQGKPTSAAGPAQARGDEPWSFYDGATEYELCNLYPGEAKTPANVTRIATWGGGNAQNKTNLERLNAGVAERLTKSSRSMLRHYFMHGAQWTTGQPGTAPSGTKLVPPAVSGIPGAHGTSGAGTDDIQRGSLLLANTSMETFTQRQNCFDCHNSSAHTVTVGAKAVVVPQKAINLSHFVVNYQAGMLTR